MIQKNNLSRKVNKTELMYLLGVSYPTALKEYAIILDSLTITKRNYLTINDLIIYGIL